MTPKQQVLRTALDETTALFDQLERGEISLRAWRTAMAQTLTAAHAAAYIAGSGRDTLTRGDQRALAEATRFHLDKLATFARDMRGRDLTPRDRARAQLYAGGVKESYARGQAGGYRLPGYPAQGTQCMTNCGCEWQQQTGDGVITFTWARQKDDSCETCLQREADWSSITFPAEKPQGLLGRVVSRLRDFFTR